MESIKTLYLASRLLFLITGSLIFFFGFCLHNGFFAPWSKNFLLIIDIPFIFFTLVFFTTRVFMQEPRNTMHESLAVFAAAIFFAFVLFFHFGFPNLI